MTRNVLIFVIVLGLMGMSLFAALDFLAYSPTAAEGERAHGGSGLRLTNARQITHAAGRAVGQAGSPAWSDTGLLAYHAQADPAGDGAADGAWDVWLTQIGSGSPVNRTADVDGDALEPALSPDGATIVFSVVEDAEGWPPVGRGLYALPSLGGTPRLLAPSERPGRVAWSADGQRMAWMQWTPPAGWELVVADVDAEVERTIRTPDADDAAPARAELAWSRDGTLFAWQSTTDPRSAHVGRLWILRDEDGVVFPVTDGRSLSRSPGFAPDGRALTYVSDRGGSPDVWWQALAEDGEPVGEPEALTSGLGVGSAAFSPDGLRVACTRGGELWLMDVERDD